MPSVVDVEARKEERGRGEIGEAACAFSGEGMKDGENGWQGVRRRQEANRTTRYSTMEIGSLLSTKAGAPYHEGQCGDESRHIGSRTIGNAKRRVK